MPCGPAACRLGRDLGGEFRALELERLELGVDRLVELVGGLAPRRRERGGRRAVTRLRLARRGFERGQPLGAGIDEAEIGGIARRQRVELVDRHVVLARRRPQREQPLLDPLELARIVVGRAQRRLEMRARVFERRERRIERLHRRLDQRRRLRARGARAGAPPPRAPAPATARPRPPRAHRAGRRRPSRPASWRRAARRARVSSAGSGCEPRELLDRVAQPVGLALRALDLGALRGEPPPRARAARPTAARPRCASPSSAPKASSSARWVAASTSARSSCWPWISTSAAPSVLQHLRAHRLVVDEGAGAAVGELHAAQDQFVLGRDAVVREQRARRMRRAADRTPPSPGPAPRHGAPARRRRARRAPAQRHRAGSTCRRRSRR